MYSLSIITYFNCKCIFYLDKVRMLVIEICVSFSINMTNRDYKLKPKTRKVSSL